MSILRNNPLDTRDKLKAQTTVWRLIIFDSDNHYNSIQVVWLKTRTIPIHVKTCN